MSANRHFAIGLLVRIGRGEFPSGLDETDGKPSDYNSDPSQVFGISDTYDSDGNGTQFLVNGWWYHGNQLKAV